MRIGREQGSNMFFMCPLLLGWTFFESGEAIEGLRRMGDAVAATRQSARRFYFRVRASGVCGSSPKVGENWITRSKFCRKTSIASGAVEIACSRPRYIVCWACATGIWPRPDRGSRNASDAGYRDLRATRRTLFRTTRGDKPWSTLAGSNRSSEAHNLVSKVYNRFTEGFNTSDLKEARALLDELKVVPMAAPRDGRSSAGG